MQTVQIQAEKRDANGKKEIKTLRKSGKIPAVLYGKGINVLFSTTKNQIKHLIYTPDFKIAEINVDGKVYKSVVKDVVYHPLTEEVQHIDFVNLSEGRKLKFDIPVKFRGTSPGVKSGGKLIQNLRKVRIKATPSNLIAELVADISTTELGQAIRVRDLDLAEGVEILTPEATPIAVVEVPRALKSAQDAELGLEEQTTAGIVNEVQETKE